MTASSRLAAAALLLAAQAGCTVAAVGAKEDARPKNSCSSSDSCGRGESCLAGLCQSLNGQLEAVLLAATPDFQSSLPRLTFVTHHSLEASEVKWPGPANVTGSLALPAGHCYPEFISDDPTRAILASTDGTLPVSATLSLRQRTWGLPQQTYYAKTVTAPLSGYTFDVQVPGGEYDVYLVPPRRYRGTCAVPPQLFRGVPIGVNESASNGAYRFNLAAVSELNLHLLWPEASPSLEGWTADLIDHITGNRISTEVVLASPARRQSLQDYSISLAYSSVTDSSGSTNVNSSEDLVRLRPPAEVVAPTIYLERSGLGLLQDPTDPVDVTVFTRFPSPVSVRGKMVSAEDGRAVSGTVTFTSKKIYGVDAGLPASFQTTATVGEDGELEVALSPGQYIVEATPPVFGNGAADSLSMLATEWDIPADAPQQFGKLLELYRLSRVTGLARVQGAQAQADPIPLTPRPFDEAYGEQPLVPRATGALVDDAGWFALQVDELVGTRINISVQAPEELGFGWFVRPGLTLGGGDHDLGRVNLPVPSVLSGLAVVQGASGDTPLASASIRAYAYLNKDYEITRDPSAAVTVVQVAATRADPSGAFRLLLPSTIHAPK